MTRKQNLDRLIRQVDAMSVPDALKKTTKRKLRSAHKSGSKLTTGDLGQAIDGTIGYFKRLSTSVREVSAEDDAANGLYRITETTLHDPTTGELANLSDDLLFTWATNNPDDAVALLERVESGEVAAMETRQVVRIVQVFGRAIEATKLMPLSSVTQVGKKQKKNPEQMNKRKTRLADTRAREVQKRIKSMDFDKKESGVIELAMEFNVSTRTIWRDLEKEI